MMLEDPDRRVVRGGEDTVKGKDELAHLWAPSQVYN